MSSPPLDLSPDGIRTLRGQLSRADFASRVGVTPLTIYRWELPPEAPQSRRPRGKTRAKLEAAVGGERALEARSSSHPEGESPAPLPVAVSGGGLGLTDSEESSLLPLLEALGRAHWAEVEAATVKLMASGTLRTIGARALAQVTLAVAQHEGRNDVATAFGTLAPALAEAMAGRLPGPIAVRAHVAAALLFATPDGRFFDLGRVNAHVARAEELLGPFGTEGHRSLLRAAQVLAAWHHGDTALFQRLLVQHGNDLGDPSIVASRCRAIQVRAVAALVAGRLVEATRLFEDLASEAAAGHVTILQCRALAQLAALKLEGGESPEAVLALVKAGREAADAAHLSPGLHDVLRAAAEGEALVRLGLFEEARAVVDEGLSVCALIEWPAVDLVMAQTRLHLLTGESGALKRISAGFAARRAGPLGEVVATCSTFLAGVAAIAEGNSADARRYLAEAGSRIQDSPGRPWLALWIRTFDFAVQVHESDGELAIAARDRALRLLDRTPSSWFAALINLFNGILHARLGHAEEARQELETAEATFRMAGDVPGEQLALRGLAMARFLSGEKDGERLLEESESELRRLGISIPSPLRREAVDDLASSWTCCESLKSTDRQGGDLLVPIRRLAVRGFTPQRLLQELAGLAGELSGGRTVRVEEVEGEGCAESLEGSACFEIGDGCGRRYQLCVDGAPDGAMRAVFATLAAVASLSLEVATLRSLSSPAVPEDETDLDDNPDFVAASPSMRNLRIEIARLSRSRATVMLFGESGTGKEVVAEAVHRHSTRSSQPFVTFNCTAVPRELFEGQLFGYRRGAFTGATSNQPGVIRAADGGTLFMDEVGDLPLDLQPKLLRFLENGEILPLGESTPVKVDVRVVAATHRDLANMVKEGEFREDLFYRLHVVPMRLLPLRERREDILALAKHFLAKLTPDGAEPPLLSAAASGALLEHPWPGNAREVRNVIERALAFDPIPRVLGVEHLRIEGAPIQ